MDDTITNLMHYNCDALNRWSAEGLTYVFEFTI